jgi:hypothetical protein
MDDTSACNDYAWKSQNVRDYGMCCDKARLDVTGDCVQLNGTAPGVGGPNNAASCKTYRQAGVWVERGKWGTAAPTCKVSPYARDNQPADMSHPYGVDPAPEMPYPKYTWKVPGDVLDTLGANEATCVLRVRYNLTSTDYDGRRTNRLFNGVDAKVSRHSERAEWAD